MGEDDEIEGIVPTKKRRLYNTHKKRALAAESLLKRIKLVDVKHTKDWFADIDYYFNNIPDKIDLGD